MKDATDTIVGIETEGQIGLIRLSRPPVNTFGVALRRAVHEAHEKLFAVPSVRAIVLYGAGRFFSAGTVIRDFGKADVAPSLQRVLKALNDNEKAVICRIARSGLRRRAESDAGLPSAHRCVGPADRPAGGEAGAPARGWRPGPSTSSARDATLMQRRLWRRASSNGLWMLLRAKPGLPRRGTRWRASFSRGRPMRFRSRRTQRQSVPRVNRLQAKPPALAAPLKALEAVWAATLPINEGLAKSLRFSWSSWRAKSAPVWSMPTLPNGPLPASRKMMQNRARSHASR